MNFREEQTVLPEKSLQSQQKTDGMPAKRLQNRMNRVLK